MFDIPNKFIISSRLSTHDSQDILRILQLAELKWDEQILKKRMGQYPQIPIACIGISNPQELERVIHDHIPVIHIQEDCIALQRVQERQDQRQNCINYILWIGTSSAWSLVGYGIKKIKTEKDNKWVIALCGGTTCLSLWTFYVMHRMKQHYTFIKDDKHAILIRRDVMRSRRNTLIQALIPFWAFIGYSVEAFNKL